MKNNLVTRLQAFIKKSLPAWIACSLFAFASIAPLCIAEEENEHPTLAIGSAAPNFSLPGIDGKTHTLAE